MTNKEMAAYLKLAEETAFHLTAEGKILRLKVGASWRFHKSDIERWIIAQKQGRP